MAINTPSFRKTVGSVALNSTYNTINFDYYPMVSISDRPILWDARYSQEWASGKVAYEHNKLLSSGIAGTAIKVRAKRILGSNLIFKKGKDTKSAGDTVDYIRDECYKLKINQVLEAIETKSSSAGSAFFVLNPTKDKIMLDALGIDQVYCTFKGNEIVRAKIFINFIDDNGGKNIASGRYFLIEERYFDEDGTPYSINKIYKSVIPQNEGASSSFSYGWRDNKSDNATDVTDMFSEGTAIVSDYVLQQIKDSGLKFNFPFKLPFKGLGIAHCKNTSSSLKHPNSRYGDPTLIDCYDLMWTYDYTFSILAKDLYVGRPMTFIPDTMNGNKMMQNNISDAEFAKLYYNNRIETPAVFDDEFIKVPNYDMNYQTPTTVQYDIRSEELKVALDDIATQIAHNIGLEPQTLISALTQTNETKTAFEVANEASISNVTVLRKRDLIQDALNEIIDELCYYYGKNADDVMVCFPPLEELNKTLTADYIVKLRSCDGMSDEMLVNIAYKDLTEAEKEEELNRIKTLRQEKESKQEKREEKTAHALKNPNANQSLDTFKKGLR